MTPISVIVISVNEIISKLFHFNLQIIHNYRNINFNKLIVDR